MSVNVVVAGICMMGSGGAAFLRRVRRRTLTLATRTLGASTTRNHVLATTFIDKTIFCLTI